MLVIVYIRLGKLFNEDHIVPSVPSVGSSFYKFYLFM